LLVPLLPIILRKGPWFRLDDIYSKYYAPKKKSASFEQLAQEPPQEQEEPATKEPANSSKKHFFRPHMTDNQAKRKSSDSSIDELLQRHVDACLNSYDMVTGVSHWSSVG
jgi:hypothetical protein